VVTDTITWPELVNLARIGLVSREPFDVAQGDLMARGIVAMDHAMGEVLGERRAFMPASALPPGLTDAPVERCLFCGTAVTPGVLIGNTLANGAAPKMLEMVLRTGKLYTDELGALRTRVAELEQLNQAAAKATDALEAIGDQAVARIAVLESACRCGATALRMHDAKSPTAIELDRAAGPREPGGVTWAELRAATRRPPG
jgi:hypothetical protein